MKKATVGSTAVWAGAAVILIGYQLSSQTWPIFSNRSFRQIVTWVSIGIIAASLGLMKDADPSELFPAASNTGKRNYLNIANFIAAVMAGLSFGYLSGLFGSVQAHSHAFSLAAILLVVGIGFQTYFAVVTTRRV